MACISVGMNKGFNPALPIGAAACTGTPDDTPWCTRGSMSNAETLPTEYDCLRPDVSEHRRLLEPDSLALSFEYTLLLRRVALRYAL